LDYGRIDVGVPVYRGGEHLAATLQSLLDQTYTDFTVLISIDAGDEGSAEVCRPFLADPRFRVVVQERRLGWAGNLNWLVSQSTADFFSYYQQDDLTDPSYFEVLTRTAAEHPGAAMVFSNLKFFGDDDGYASGPSIMGDEFSRTFKQLEAFSHVPFRGLIRSQALRTAKDGIRLTEHESFGEDFVWVLKLARVGDLINVPRPLYFKRRHGKSTSRAWFEDWPDDKRRSALIALCVGLLEAVLPSARTNAQRFLLLYAVLERLALRQWFYAVNRLSPVERAELICDFVSALRDSGTSDAASVFGADWNLLTALSLRRFALPEWRALPAAPSAGAAGVAEDANHCLREKLGYELNTDIDFTRPESSRRYMQGLWGETTPDGVWTHGPLAELVLWPDLPAAVGRTLRMHVQPFLQNVERLSVTVLVDGTDQGFLLFRSSEAQGCQIPIPAGLGDSGSRPLRITFWFRNLPSASSLGLAEDAPVLGLRFISASIADTG
jgi:glycosyltransferase involved in cell wall biosynthesis